MKKVFGIILFSLLLSEGSMAGVNCSTQKVKEIEVQDGMVIFRLEDNVWHKLGPVSSSTSNTAVNYKLSVLMTAYTTGKKILASFPDGYNCGVSNFNDSSLTVRMTEVVY